jgi:hypothetical protein
MGTYVICIMVGVMIGGLYVTHFPPKSDGESNETL